MTKLVILFLFFLPHVFSKPIIIRYVRDMNFGTLVQGDGAKTIIPSSSNPNSAQFNIRGDKNTSYTIILPVTSSISLNGLGNLLSLTNFTSSPAEGANGLLNSKGRQTLYVGATLQSLSVSTQIGSYFGSFSIDVIY